MTKYLVNKSNDNTYYRKYIKSSYFSPPHHFQHNTEYGVEIIELKTKTNCQERILRNGDIVWFDSILVNPDDICKLTHIKIYIGGILIWNIPFDLILKLCKQDGNKLYFYDKKIKITIPKKLFLNNNIYKSSDLYELNSILLLCLKHHEVRFEISSILKNVEYTLYQEFVHLNHDLKNYFEKNDFKLSINQIYNISYLDKMAIYNKLHPLSNFSSFRNFNEFNYTSFKLLDTIFSSDIKNVIPYVNYINTIKKYIETKIFIDVLILIILEYIELQEIESNIINPLIIKNDYTEYLVFIENMDIKNGKANLINYDRKNSLDKS
jgi:hypothetical protein